MTLLFILLSCAVIALVWAEVRQHSTLVWIFKPLASSCFIAAALLCGALETDYGRWLLAGLVLCACGDVLLIPRREVFFKAGLASFLLGHVLYSIAFAQLAPDFEWMLIGLVPALLLGILTLRWLGPHLAADMRVPVWLYVLVICSMLVVASGCIGPAGGLAIALGAWGFAASDIAVARNQFVHPGPVNRVWGLPLYFFSQLLLASTPALIQG